MVIDTVYNNAGLQAAQQAAAGQPDPAGQAQAERQRPQAHTRDTYEPEDATLTQPIGVYRITGAGEASKIEFDDPEPKKEAGTANVTVTDTDDVDREIEQLKEKQEQLSQQVQREDDPQKREQLERRLAQVEQELSQKDNDTYRRQHAEIS